MIFYEACFTEQLLIFFGSSVIKINDSNKTALWAAPDVAHVNFCKLLLDNSVIVDSIRTGNKILLIRLLVEKVVIFGTD